jgi:hypothetical protein
MPRKPKIPTQQQKVAPQQNLIAAQRSKNRSAEEQPTER